MATKKKAPKKEAKKSTLIKIAETIGTVAGEIAVKKDKFVRAAANVIDSVKFKVNDVKAAKKPVARKVKSAVKKTTKSIAPAKAAAKKAVTKKSTTVKPVKKAAAKPVKKAAKVAAKKIAKISVVKKGVKKQ